MFCNLTSLIPRYGPWCNTQAIANLFSNFPSSLDPSSLWTRERFAVPTKPPISISRQIRCHNMPQRGCIDLDRHLDTYVPQSATRPLFWATRLLHTTIWAGRTSYHWYYYVVDDIERGGDILPTHGRLDD